MKFSKFLGFGLSMLLGGGVGAQELQESGEALLSFTEVSVQAGVAFEHRLPADQKVFEPLMMNSGVAAGDLDADGWPDLLAVRGPEAGNVLYRNRGDGSFENVTAGSGLRLLGAYTHGVGFADVDNDGDLDVLFGGVLGNRPRLFLNNGGFTFEDVTLESGLVSHEDTFSAAFSDIDSDGDLDVFVTHWSGVTGPVLPANHLWRNDGTGSFSPIDFIAGAAPLFEDTDWSFTPNFVDLDRDGDADLVLATDFGGSAVLLNQGDGLFDIVTNEVISDENGMGAAIGDFDGDGVWDWFVSSIWDPNGINEGNWGVSGNRLYRGLGDGSFEDVTEASGVREGFWGWGSCAADFDLDRDLDLYHVNGFSTLQAVEFLQDPARLFLNDGSGTFVERSEALAVADTGQGRGIVCFDYDGDGDIDIFVTNNRGPSRLFRNELLSAEGGEADSGPHWLSLDLRRPGGNGFAVGAEIRAFVAGQELLRQVQAGSNFLSQNPLRIHFGLGDRPTVDELEIRWPDGEIERYLDVAGDRIFFLRQGGPVTVEIPALGRPGIVLLSALLAAIALWRLRLS